MPTSSAASPPNALSGLSARCAKKKKLRHSVVSSVVSVQVAAPRGWAEAATHLSEHVLPLAPYRPFVVSFPIPLRYWLHTNKRFAAEVYAIVTKAIHRYLHRQGHGSGHPGTSARSKLYQPKSPDYENRKSKSLEVRSAMTLPSSAIMPSTNCRLESCKARIFSSTVPRVINR